MKLWNLLVHRNSLAVLLLLPLQFLAHLRFHLDAGQWKCDQIVDELLKGYLEVADAKLSFNLALHSLGGCLSTYPLFVEQFVVHQIPEMLHLHWRGWTPQLIHHVLDPVGNLLFAHGDIFVAYGWFRVWLYQPWLFISRIVGVLQPTFGVYALHGSYRDIDRRTLMLGELGIFLRRIFAAPLPFAVYEDGVVAFLIVEALGAVSSCHLPQSKDVAGQGAYQQRFALGFLQSITFILKIGKSLDFN